jgi:hypothetical protein
MMKECGIVPIAAAVRVAHADVRVDADRATFAQFHPTPVNTPEGLFFPPAASARGLGKPTLIPAFDAARDPAGAASFVPHMDHFFNNSVQSALLRALGVDLEPLGEHLVLLGNQGVGKNKLVDRLCQLLRRPREYVQLHRDSTVHQLLFATTLERGVIRHEDSPLLRAVRMGRVLVVDEADKAPEHVVAVFRSLAGQGELSLPDGRRIRKKGEREGDIVIKDGFRLVLLANRPGYRERCIWFFDYTITLNVHQRSWETISYRCSVITSAGVCTSLLLRRHAPTGAACSHSISNPDLDSELRLLSQLAPELEEDTIRRLVGAFQDLRKAYDDGVLAYPYSLRGKRVPVWSELKYRWLTRKARAHRDRTAHARVSGRRT